MEVEKCNKIVTIPAEEKKYYSFEDECDGQSEGLENNCRPS